MSGSAKNIQRDGTWVNPLITADLAWAAETAITVQSIFSNSAAAVYTDVGQAHLNEIAYNVTAANKRCIGTLMAYPEGDNQPYRVKASGTVLGQSKDDYTYAIVLGWAPASPTGSGDSIANPYYIPFQEEYDDLIMVPHQESTDPYFERALFVGIALFTHGGISLKHCKAHISVQNLGTKPPTMINAVS